MLAYAIGRELEPGDRPAIDSIFELYDLEIDPSATEWQSRCKVQALELPPGRTACQMIEGEPATAAAELVRLLRQEAKVI